MRAVLNTIGEQTGAQFACIDFNDLKDVSYSCQNKALKLVLNELLEPLNCTYKQANNYFIIKGPKAASKLQDLFGGKPIRGCVYDRETKLPLKDVSVYNAFSKEMIYTDENGIFVLNNSEKFKPYPLTLAKENYADSTLQIYNPGENSLSIYLYPNKTMLAENMQTNPVKDSSALDQTEIFFYKPFLAFSDFWVKRKQKNINFRNIKDTLYNEFNVSLLPYISTNHLLDINTVNKISINILGGVSKGVEAIEIGGLFNYDLGSVNYIQIAGLLNYVEGKVTGTQISACINFNHSNTNALQVAGLFNVVLGDFKKIQFAGIGNFVNGSVSGVQVASLFNVNRLTTNGIQFGGLFNVNLDTLTGLQIGGLANINLKPVYGVQVASLYNYAPSVKGPQVGLVNKAQQLNGVQAGLVNISTTCVEGLPVGFFSFVADGYHKIELSTDEKFLTSLSFRTGLEKFHNVFLFGTQIGTQNPVYTYGYGLGSLFEQSKWWQYGFDFTTQQLVAVNSETESLNLVTKFVPNAVLLIQSKFQLLLGCSVNLSIFDNTSVTYLSNFNSYPPSYFYNENFGNNNLKGWIGYKVGLRFL
jgi:hypothetical protein